MQFYDVVIDGVRHARNAWVYEAPQPKMEAVRDRFGFWEDVQVSYSSYGRPVPAISPYAVSASATGSGPADRSSP